MKAKTIISIILLAIFIIVFIQNAENVKMNFLFWSFEISKLLTLLITLIVGIIIGLLIPGMFSKTQKKEAEGK